MGVIFNRTLTRLFDNNVISLDFLYCHDFFVRSCHISSTNDSENWSYIVRCTVGCYNACKLEKRGDEINKKSSPLKLLSQSQPNFAEMILGWPPFQDCVRWFRLPTKMAAKLKIEKGGMKF